MARPAIEVQDLVKTYPQRGGPALRAVDALTFDVAAGSIFGLLGPNGAGKTTTLRILTTLARPTAGQARVAGFDVATDPLNVRRRIAVVIQEQAVDLLLTVRDNLLSFARFHGVAGAEARRRANAVMEQFDILEYAVHKTQDLSGGYKRRVQVAKMFMVDTPVIFLDEFSTGMDPILKRAVMASLRAEAGRGRTIVLTTQVLTEAEELCDDILIMNRGRQVARGDLHALKLLSDTVYDITITFEELPPDLESTLARLQPVRSAINRTTLQVTVKGDDRRVLTVVNELTAAGRVQRLEVGTASLEDVFVALTRGARP
jgi:ABC-2 type transport system ATP-binding protein